MTENFIKQEKKDSASCDVCQRGCSFNQATRLNQGYESSVSVWKTVLDFEGTILLSSFSTVFVMLFSNGIPFDIVFTENEFQFDMLSLHRSDGQTVRQDLLLAVVGIVLNFMNSSAVDMCKSLKTNFHNFSINFSPCALNSALNNFPSKSMWLKFNLWSSELMKLLYKSVVKISPG